MSELGAGVELCDADDELFEMLLAEQQPEMAPASESQSPLDGELPYPTLGQERLWFFDQLEPGSAAYNVGFSLDLRGPLQVPVLERSVLEVARRHEPLRMHFVVIDSLPRLRITDEPRVDFSYHQLPESESSDEALRRRCQAHALRSFDLQQGPLFSVSVWRVSDSRHVLAVALHHSVADGWSLALLQKELAALYSAFVAGRPSPLRPLATSYSAYAAWQRQARHANGLAEQVAYWREALRDAPLNLALPTDYTRPAVQTYRGGRASLLLSADFTARLKEFGVYHAVSRFMLFAAALGALLAKISEQDQIMIGTPIADRRMPGSEALIGYLLNTLPLRVDLRGEPTFGELLLRVRDTCLAAYDHSDLPFESMLELARVPRDTSRAPLFQVLLNLLDFDWRPELAGLEVEPFSATELGSKFDLTLYVREQAGRLCCEFGFNADLFTTERVRELLGQLEATLRFVVCDETKPLATLSLLTEEARRILPDPCAPLVACWQGSLMSRFSTHAKHSPHALAVVDSERSWSYAELERDSRLFAQQLRAADLAPGGVVAVHAERDGRLAVALLGIWRAGAPFVILDPAHPVVRRADIVRQARPKLFVELRSAPLSEPELELELSSLACRRVFVTVNREDAEWLPGEMPDVPPDSTAYLAFTSGTAGKPKGIIGGHRPLSHFFSWQAERFGLTARDRFSVLSGLSHDPLLRDLFLPLWVGGTAIFPERDAIRDGFGLHAWLSTERVSVVHLTPSHGEVLAAARSELPALGSLRYLFFAGEPLGLGLLRRLKSHCASARCVNLYGATETPQGIAEYAVPWPNETRPAPIDSVPIGSGIDGVQLLVLDTQDQLCGVGEPGEVVVRSPYLAAGYLDPQAAYTRGFGINPLGKDPEDRVYRTGDFARYRPDGTLCLLGRRDGQEKIRGHRLEPREIELVFEQHPDVERAIVRACDHPALGRCLIAYLVGTHSGDTAMLEWARARLPDFMLPAQVITLPSVPLSENRKLDPARLPAPSFDSPNTTHEPPRTPTERRLAEIWGELLGRTDVGRTASFFELGGHSLTATRLMARVRDVFGVELPLRSVFEARTLGAFGQQVDAALERGPSPSRGPSSRDVSRATRELRASFAQQRLWFLTRLEPDAPTYFLSYAVVIRGPLDVSAFRLAVSDLGQRQAAFRTSFRDVDGEATQTIHAQSALSLEFVDLGQQNEALLRRQISNLQRAPFKLTRAPLARFRLLRTADGEHTLLLVMHHLISDGWSLGVLMRDLSAFYAARTQNQTPALPELRIDYGDYSEWQRAQLVGEPLNSELRYWSEQLHDLPQALSLPTRRPHGIPALGAASTWTFRLPFARDTALDQYARGRGVTRFMVLLAGFAALLANCSGHDDIPIGSPVANRGESETADLIGFFVNTLVLRVRIPDDFTFGELLERVRETTLEAYDHQALPFARLVQELAPARGTGRSPLFQVFFALRTEQSSTFGSAGLELSPLELPPPAAQFELTLVVEERATELLAHFHYPTDLFERETIVSLSQRLTLFLERAAHGPEQRLHALLAPATAAPPLEFSTRVQNRRTLADFPAARFEAQARRTPHAIALDSDRAALSYAALDARVRRLARRLRALDLGAEPLIGVYAGRGFEFVVAWLAVLKVGAAFLPLDPELPRGRLASLLKTAQPRLVLTTRALASDLPTGVGSLVVSEISLANDPCPPISVALIQPQQLAYVIFTSGSTGEPKGVLLQQGGLANLARSQVEAFGLGPGSRQLQFASLGFDAAVSEVFTALTSGATLCLAAKDELDSGHGLLALLERRSVTHVTLPPSLLAALPERQMPQLSTLISAGEACSSQVVSRWGKGRTLLNAYGPTEVTVCATLGECVDDGRSPSIGRPLANQSCFLLDARLDLAAALAPAQMAVGGAGVARGYLRDAAATARAFIPDEFSGEPGARLYLTGDVARQRADGSLEFLGRRDEQVKIRGYRVELAELEGALLKAGLAREVCVVARSFADDLRLVAYLVGDQRPSLEIIKQRLQLELPHYLLPSAVVHLSSLPRTPNGKLDRAALPAPTRVETATSIGPKNDLEFRLLAIFERLLGVTPIGTDEDFFALGGHSLLALRLLSEIERAFGQNLPLRVLFQTASVAHLANALGSDTDADQVLVPLSRCNHVPALFLVHPIGGQLFGYRELVQRLGEQLPIVGVRAGLEAESMVALGRSYAEAIVRQQPSGPYRLAGWSFGGYLALEAARHLSTQGRSVDFLALIDCRFPSLVQAPNERQLRLEFLRNRVATHGILDPSKLAQWSDADWTLPALAAALKSQGSWPEDAELKLLERELRLLRQHFGLLAGYQPASYDGRLSAFFSRATHEQVAGAPKTWRRLVSSYEEHVLPGDHYSLLRTPHVDDLACALRAALEEASAVSLRTP